jgi:hypothetical protein
MKTLIFLALLSSSASAQIFGGFNACYDKKPGVGVEVGYKLESGPAFSLDFGTVIGSDEMPEHDTRAWQPSSRTTFHDYMQSGTLFGSLNAGYYFPSGLGVFGSFGLVRSEVATLIREYAVMEGRAYYGLVGQRKVTHGSVGADLRYHNALGYFRAGYATRRGAIAGFGLMF